MKKISRIGNLLKKLYKGYNQGLFQILFDQGYIDLRASYIEIMIFICEHEGATIKSIGDYCGLKKQTMTSHLNELETRGYIKRIQSPEDKREQNVFLSSLGENFRIHLYEAIAQVEDEYEDVIGSVELERIEKTLQHFFRKTKKGPQLELFTEH